MTFLKDVFMLYVDRFGYFYERFIEHLYLTSVAIIFIMVIGITSGILMTYNRRFAQFMLSLTGFLYTIPSIAIFGILIPITGIGGTSAIIALSIYGVLPLIRNTYVGIMEVDENILEAAVGMGSTTRQVLFRIKLPLASPVILAGFRTTVTMTIALGTIAGLIGAGGLGRAIWSGIALYHLELTIAASLLIAFFAVSADQLLNLAEKAIRHKIFGKKERNHT
ncbi:MAG: ABC transporter permease [Acholeplasmataceae bacterium]|nr:ABC transporter permease [Acholeplasmataceae bacterium]